MWFMQDGATQHTANIILDFLHGPFGPRVMSGLYPDRLACEKIWPHSSPEINSWEEVAKKICFQKIDLANRA
jgi:hypothetical protein